MIDHLKYIVHNIAGYEEPVIFGNGYQHVMMAQLMGIQDNIVSAGFLQIGATGAKCYGESMTLKVASRPKEDSALINRMAGDNVG